MKNQHRRFIFIDYENLKKIKFKKLEKVCDKIFIFINASEADIPFDLVQQMQRLGRSVKWITIDSGSLEDMNYHICFQMGYLHQKIESSVEFAVLSNEKSFDVLISSINSEGRSCIRIKNKKQKVKVETAAEEAEHLELDQMEPVTLPIGEQSNSMNAAQNSVIASEFDPSQVDLTAKDTINKLITSGNRPADIAMLRHYILLNNQELAINGGVDRIIHRLEEEEEIKISEGEVTYNF